MSDIENCCVIKKGNKLRVDLLENSKRLGALLITEFIVLILGAFMFFYIEHCYEVINPEKTIYEIAFDNLCEIAKKENNSTNITKMNTICRNVKLENARNITCEVNKENIVKWMDYSFTIALTVGKQKIIQKFLKQISHQSKIE